MRFKIKLNSVLLLSFLALIITVVLLLSVGSRYMIENAFESYLMETQVQKMDELRLLLQKLMNRSEDLALSTAVLDNYLNNNRLMLAVYDPDGGLLYENMTLHGMGKGMMRNRMADYQQEQFAIEKEGRVIAYAQVGYFGDFAITARAEVFRRSLQQILLVTALLALIIGIGISLYLTRVLKKPVLEVGRVAKAVSSGNYSVRAQNTTAITELSELSDHINHMATVLDRQEISRREFMLSMGHELKTPLTIIKTQTEAITDGILEPSSENLGSISEEVDRIHNLIEQLERLNILKDSEQEAPQEVVELSEEISKSIAAFKLRLEQGNLTLHTSGFDHLIQIKTSRIQLRQIVDNLLVNAIKYAESGSAIDLAIDRKGAQITLEMTNAAKTIPPQELGQIFDIHFRTENAKLQEGRGIGLYVTKALVQKLGGTIAAESKDDCFTVRVVLKDGQ